MNYWLEALEAALEDCGAENALTPEQKLQAASVLRGAAETIRDGRIDIR